MLQQNINCLGSKHSKSMSQCSLTSKQAVRNLNWEPELVETGKDVLVLLKVSNIIVNRTGKNKQQLFVSMFLYCPSQGWDR